MISPTPGPSASWPPLLNGASMAGTSPTFRTRYEKIEERPDIPSAPHLSADDLAVLQAEEPELSVDIQDIQLLMSSPNSEDEVRRYAQTKFDGEPVRQRKRTLAVSWMAHCDQLLARWKEFQHVELDCCRYRSRCDHVLKRRVGDPSVFVLLVKSTWLAGSVLLFLVAFLAEFVNAIYLCRNSGLGVEDHWLTALCFTFIIVLGPFVSLKYWEKMLNDRGRQAFSRWLNRVATPLATATVAIFAITIGLLMDADSSLFGETARPWIPPLYILLLAEMLSLAIFSCQLAFFINSSLGHFVEPITTPNSIYADAATRINLLDEVIMQVLRLRAEMEAILNRINADRHTFKKQCLAELGYQQRLYAAKQAQMQTRIIQKKEESSYEF